MCIVFCLRFIIQYYVHGCVYVCGSNNLFMLQNNNKLYFELFKFKLCRKQIYLDKI